MVDKSECCPNTIEKCNQVEEMAALNECYLFREDCNDCDDCRGIGGFTGTKESCSKKNDPFKSLSLLDKYLWLLVLIAMIIGVVIGVYAKEGVQEHLQNSAQWEGVSIPILLGLLVMIWPALAKVNWEKLSEFYKDLRLWVHIAMSIFINWVLSPLLMLGLAWACLPEDSMERYRKGVLLVGVSRCIAMVIIWTTIADGDVNYCAYLMVINSLLQIVLFSPYSLLFVNLLGGNSGGPDIQLDYEHTARSVGIYLGIPLAAGIVTRFALLKFTNATFKARFYSFASKIGLTALLYTIIILFAAQGQNIIDNIGQVCRTVVPLIAYFIIVWNATFLGFWRLNMSRRFSGLAGGYERAVTQAFTAGSNNFELAIAVATASFGPDAPETLAATLGPLIEVPVLLLLSYLALYLHPKLFKREGGVRIESA